MPDPHEGKAFGLIPHVDPRSRNFAMSAGPIVDVKHKRHVPIYDQGQVGSCTGNALCGALSSGPWRHKFREASAVKVYSLATRLDEDPTKQYPPDDTGATAINICRAAQQRKWITEYRHAFDLDTALSSLAIGPVLIGIGWLTGMDRYDGSGVMDVSGQIRGWHEVMLREVNTTAKTVIGDNSWGTSWGRAGSFELSWDGLQALLANQGDVTLPMPMIPAPKPAPVPPGPVEVL